MAQVKEEAAIQEDKKALREQKKERNDKEELERIRSECPELLDEFEQMLDKKYVIDERLAFLQKEMILGRDWLWMGVRGNLSQYTKEEQELIDEVGGNYYAKVEQHYLAHDEVRVNVGELITLIHKAGVDTKQREGCILHSRYNGDDHITLVIHRMHEPLRKVDVPRSLRF